MKLPIILIGPMYSGKSTIAKILAKKLSLREVSVDYIAGYYYTRDGIDMDKLVAVSQTDDFTDYFNFIRPYEISAAVSITNDFSNSVISFGAGHSYATELTDREKLLTIKEKTQNIFLLLPSSDITISERVLSERMNTDRKGKMSDERLRTRQEVNKNLILADSNKQLANHTIYTESKNPEQVANEIISLIV